VARKGAKRSIFEGNMPPKKMYPQYWRQYWCHNRNPVNVIIYSVISLLREDPLSTGILDMFFFRKYRIMCLFPKREFISLKFAQIINSTNHQTLSVGDNSSP
jgi:hypothetical protein